MAERFQNNSLDFQLVSSHFFTVKKVYSPCNGKDFAISDICFGFFDNIFDLFLDWNSRKRCLKAGMKKLYEAHCHLGFCSSASQSYLGMFFNDVQFYEGGSKIIEH